MKSSLVALALLASPALAEESGPGHVQVPLTAYEQLLNATREKPRPAPAGFALGQARVTLSVQAAEGRASGEIQVELSVQVLEDQWVLVPVLPAGTSVASATVDGAPVPLVSTPAGLGWATNQKGAHQIALSYRVDAQGSAGGFTMGVPVPAASSIVFSATLPGGGVEATVVPSAGTRVTPFGSNTKVEATVPTTSALQLLWRTPARRGHTLSRAHYEGRLAGDAVEWTGVVRVDVFGAESATVKLLPRGVTLRTLTVDGRDAPILVEGDRYAVLVQGRGAHAIRLGFETPIERADGPPRIALRIPAVPISRLDLTLPGTKDVKVTPAASVQRRTSGGTTLATVNVPMTEGVTLEWSEAVPEDVKAEASASATLYHAVVAREGVLYVRAHVDYEISRGAVSRVGILVPPGVQLNRIAVDGVTADWRMAPAASGKARVASVFLDRERTGTLRLDLDYDRALGKDDLEVPLLRTAEAQRQRGMVALLATRELTLDPQGETTATRVGENQLPAPVRETIAETVAHTFKYTDDPPRLVVKARAPDAVASRFDVQVDTLVSLGDAVLGATASVDVHVKAGGLTALQLDLPPDVTLLSLGGPSLRTHQAAVKDGRLRVDVEFTQEMEGDFRLDLAVERVLPTAANAPVDVPTVRVQGAEVEQGRIAVEALSAVEVRPAASDHLTALDVAELPSQLVLRSTHPILMAWKYLHAEPAPRLTLDLTRHALAGVQEAAVDEAVYRTLLTRDGLQVTTADLTVRNSRKQFLKLHLPRGASVWSAFVDGKPEKPALAGDETVLVKIVTSTAPFVVQLVYATEGPALAGLGRAESVLARPDVLVTKTRWDVYLPADLGYGVPASNLDLVGAGERVSSEALAKQMAAVEGGSSLRITVPAAGVHYAFEKLYANQADGDAWVAVPYASGGGASAGRLVAGLGALALWLGIALAFRFDRRLPVVSRRTAGLVSGAGLLVVALAVFRYGVGLGPALLVSLGVLALVAWRIRVWWRTLEM